MSFYQYSYPQLVDLIETEIKSNDLLQVREPAQLYQPVQYILEIGGKRVRPALVLMAANLFTDKIVDFVQTAVAMEVFHNFTLLHDDIMDNSDVRRGNPTVHKKWNSNIAILSGDAMAILSYQMLIQNNNPRFKEILQVFNKVAIQVCEGQQFDMDFEQESTVPYEEYMRMIELKTSVLIAGSLKIGALLTDATLEDAEHLYEFGLNIGLAFQIQDDYLDVFGDPSQFQKIIGGDIVSRKKTFLLIKALEIAGKDGAPDILNVLNNNEISDMERVQEIRKRYVELGVDTITRETQQILYEKALASLNLVSAPAERKKILFEFAERLFVRNY
ncbi:MAG: polyprenyl synthetase family protein [Bacteroidales bacterium]|nr:polyprenyl synthetase family protein [Bacteroidales bacterium]